MIASTAGSDFGRRARRATVVMAMLASGIVAAGLGLAPARAGDAGQPGLGLPVDCRLGEECFVQQMPDVDPGEGVRDPLCGKASYQGHDGWDIRLRSLKDIGRAAVVSVADGIVLRVRDGVPDRIFDSSRDGELVDGRECGNGVVVAHGEGLVSQYCHLKQGSVAVRPGERIVKGAALGSIGASGLAEFPHVHLSIRRDHAKVEPLTGSALGQASEACGVLTGSLFEPGVTRVLSRSPTAILDAGLAAVPPELKSLVRQGGPPPVGFSQAVVAWVWAINVEQGSLFRIRLIAPDRTTIASTETKALDRRKANYMAYLGSKHAATEGAYELRIDLLGADGRALLMSRSFEVRK